MKLILRGADQTGTSSDPVVHGSKKAQDI